MISVNLGELRLGKPDCPSDLALDGLNLNELPPEEAAALRSHIEHCTHCTERMAQRGQGFAAFPELDADKPLRALHAFREAAARPKAHGRVRALLRGPRWAYVSAGIAMAAVLAIVLLRPADPVDDPGQGPDEVRIKGGLALHVFRQQGQDAEEMASGDRFRPGDNLRFVVDLPRPGHVSVLGIDTQGKLYAAWPLPQHVTEHRATTQQRAGKHQDLPGGVTLDDTPGEESLYLVECQSAASITQCRPEAKGALRCPSGCSTFSFKLRKAP